MKKIKVELSLDELVVISNCLSRFNDYVADEEKKKSNTKKEKGEDKTDLVKLGIDKDELVIVFSLATFGLYLLMESEGDTMETLAGAIKEFIENYSARECVDTMKKFKALVARLIGAEYEE